MVRTTAAGGCAVLVMSGHTPGLIPAPRRPRHTARAAKVAEQTRKTWLNELLVHQTRAWMEVGEKQPDLLAGFAIVLGLAGFAHAFEAGNSGSLALRTIRGAISAIEQCGKAGSVLREIDVRALMAAADHAETILREASVDAILSAAIDLRNVTYGETL